MNKLLSPLEEYEKDPQLQIKYETEQEDAVSIHIIESSLELFFPEDSTPNPNPPRIH